RLLTPANVATPAAAAAVAVPESVPPPGLAPMATVTLPANPVAVLPCASRAVTCTAGAIVAPAVVVPGCTVNASWLATPGVMLKPALLAVVTPGPAAVSVYPVPTRFTLKLPNVATPPTAATLTVPASVPLPGLFPNATVTVPVNPVTGLPSPSCAVTCTAGLIAAPATALLGDPVNTNRFAAAALTLNGP